MRLRTTAAALIGALAIVLPAAGPSLATDHDGRDGRGHRTLGELQYRFFDDDGEERSARIRPADNDTCYRLTGTTEEDPAFEVRNETRSLAVLYSDRSCGGRAERTLEPGQRARDVEVASVLFKPFEDDEGGRPGRQDDEGGRPGDQDDEGGRPGRQDDEGGRPGRQDDEGGRPGRQDDEGGRPGRQDDEGGRPGRQDDRGDEDEDFLGRVFRSIG
ncbi:hypothetical protein J7I97_08885 [Streptomyces sp. ISL-87]|uniref:hypothetical protein n=2 Tax=unclassified Streptomyces TaxID=2593676 RepID=UPI001BEBC4A6|nr:hypothetical protein [Streptomyces sp. ISL-87]MBT2608402.1 hypothetical protein [Streptomyces sp. ISL-87]